VTRVTSEPILGPLTLAAVSGRLAVGRAVGGWRRLGRLAVGGWRRLGRLAVGRVPGCGPLEHGGPGGWRRAGPFHPLAGPFTISRVSIQVLGLPVCGGG
jgi:hypothetical protein